MYKDLGLILNIYYFKNINSHKLTAMKKVFETRLEAIDWIAARAENEGQFEAMREQLMFNYIYTGTYSIDPDAILEDVVMTDKDDDDDRRF